MFSQSNQTKQHKIGEKCPKQQTVSAHRWKVYNTKLEAIYIVKLISKTIGLRSYQFQPMAPCIVLNVL